MQAAKIKSLLQHFPDVQVIRQTDKDEVYGDAFILPHCGFMSMRESEILFDLAVFGEENWLEIGSHLGWSAAVLANAGCRVVMVDPEFAPQANQIVYEAAMENIRRAGAWGDVKFCGMTSEEFFNLNHQTFDGILIDGNHDAPCPLNDAVAAAKVLNPGGVIVLHDTKGQPIMDAVEWLRANDFDVVIHDTINGLGVARQK